MSKYIVSSLSVFSEFDDEIPRVNDVISFNKKPTFEEAHAEFEEFVFSTRTGGKRLTAKHGKRTSTATTTSMATRFATKSKSKRLNNTKRW